jgi:hypothetical protein
VFCDVLKVIINKKNSTGFYNYQKISKENKKWGD